jgi:hypothetical protein
MQIEHSHNAVLAECLHPLSSRTRAHTRDGNAARINHSSTDNAIDTNHYYFSDQHCYCRRRPDDSASTAAKPACAPSQKPAAHAAVALLALLVPTLH